ncbi:MAG: ATP-binding protein [Parvibaculaceae bacterium]
MPQARRNIIRSTIVMLIVGLLALLLVVAMTIWLGERSQAYFNDVLAARNVRTAAIELRNGVQAAESSQRGYLLTGNEIYLAPYGVAKASVERQRTALFDALKANTQFAPALARLSSVLDEKFEEMEQTIRLKREGRDAEASQLILTNQGKALMDEANVFITGVVRFADDRVTNGMVEQGANASLLRWTSIISALVIIIVVGGATVAVVGYTRELAEARDGLRRLNETLESRVESRTADLAEANAELQRFAYIVTHDLRAPLVNIMGFTSEIETGLTQVKALVEKPEAAANSGDPVTAAAKEAVETDLPEAVEFIRTSTRKMDALINAILRLSREGRRTLRPETIDLKAMVAANVASLQHSIDEAQGAVEQEIDVPMLHVDRLSLEQIIGNLLDNAIKYRAPKRALRITVRARRISLGQIALEIADNGRGIAEQDHQRVFDLFRRAGPQDQRGEGIGLAFVKTLVRNIGGSISMTSAPDAGTAFRVIIPIHQQQPSHAAA